MYMGIILSAHKEEMNTDIAYDIHLLFVFATHIYH